jgi:hypothetical protein
MSQAYHDVVTVDLKTAVGTTDAIDFRGFSKACAYFPTGASSTSLTLFAAPTIDGAYEALYDGATAVAALTVAADRAVVLPDAIRSVAFLKIVTNVEDLAIQISLQSE